MEHNYSLTYKNVYLRPLQAQDIESLRIWRNNPQNTKYLSKIPPITREMQEAWYKRYLSNKNELCFAIVENEILNRVVGSLSLHDFSLESCFLGHVLIGDENAHGKKVGVNASVAATQIAFNELKLRTVKLYVFPENISAYKVYQQAGFTIADVHEVSNGGKEYTMIKDKEDQENA